MAKVVLPGMSHAARGKLGPLIFSAWRGFATVKLYKAPTQPNTAAQLSARARLAQFASAWGALSAENRAAWQQYAVDHLETDWSSVPKRLTAQNWFIRCNTRILLVGGTQIDTPPVDAAPIAPTGFVMANAGGADAATTMAWTTPVAATDHLVLYHVGPIGAGRVPRKEQASILAQHAANSGSPYEVLASTAAGKHGFWVQIIDELTGLASAPVYAELTAA